MNCPKYLQLNLKQAKGGNAKHIELLYKLMGMMIDKQEVQVEEKLQDNASVRNDIEAIKQFKAYLNNKGKSDLTIKNYVNHIKSYNVWLNKEGLKTNKIQGGTQANVKWLTVCFLSF